MRVEMFRAFRKAHADRIKLDTSGQTAVQVSFVVRLGWAAESWTTAKFDIGNMFTNRDFMLRCGVLIAGVDGAADTVDSHLLRTFEARARCFFWIA